MEFNKLTMQINFASTKDSRETRTMDTKINNIETMMVSKTDDIIDELFESFLQRYQERLKEKMKGSEFVFECVDLLCYSLPKTTLRRGKSHIKSPEWLKN